MSSDKIPYTEISTFSRLVQDYLSQKDKLLPFYNRYNSLEDYELQILEKSKQNIDRDLLVDVLKDQNTAIELSSESKSNISSLSSKNTFTITTGHQLCLFSGPLYCIYKIISAINLSEQLKERHPSYHFVPIFWMASEDHDFDEVNHIHLYGKKIKWETSQSGAVGRMQLAGIDDVLEELSQLIGEGENAKALCKILEEAYSSENTLAQASRIFLNTLFKNDGLVIIDGDDARLKKQIIPQIKKDVCENLYYPFLQKQSENLGKEYDVQAFVRKINFFSLNANNRLRIDSSVEPSIVEQNSERFSPNVLMRPLYQEKILPNLAYVGGGAEIAYWMQLKSIFDIENVPFPILVLRNSALILSKKHYEKFTNLGFTSLDLFSSEHELHKQYLRSQTKDRSIQNELSAFDGIYENMRSQYSNSVHHQIIEAEQQRHKKSLENMLKKLDRIEKQKHQSALNQISKIKEHYFPNKGLQERHNNLIEFYLDFGDNFIKKMKEELDPLDPNFVVLAL